MEALKAYFDESGKLQDQGASVIFGGLAIRTEKLTWFAREWQGLVGSHVGHLHMKEAMHFRGAFYVWRDQSRRRDDLLIACAELAFLAAGYFVVSPMNKADFRSLPGAARRRFKDPVYGGFEACVRRLAMQASRAQLHLCYDKSAEYEKTCSKLYERLKEDPDLGQQLASIEFADDKTCPGLQAADMVVYCRNIVQRDGNSARPVLKKIYQIFWPEEPPQEYMEYPKGASLGDGRLEP